MKLFAKKVLRAVYINRHERDVRVNYSELKQFFLKNAEFSAVNFIS